MMKAELFVVDFYVRVMTVVQVFRPVEIIPGCLFSYFGLSDF